MLLVRHASAGKRMQWQGDDRLRPLDARGQRQALSLPALLAEFEVGRIVSSPYVRCVQTVEPLAAARQLEVESREELAEEHQDDRGVALLRELADAAAVVCTHGGIQNALGDGLPYEKGSTWVLGAKLAPERYIRPPA